MREAQELQLHVKDIQEPTSAKDATVINQPSAKRLKKWKGLALAVLNIFFVIAGQSVGTLLGRFYYDKGGNSIWMATLVQSAAFPVLLIPLFLFPFCAITPPPTAITNTITSPSASTLTFIYISLGLLIAADNVMYSYGLLYLPVSTFSLICASQLAFNVLFSYFLNSQKVTLLILNSVVLLTFSATLLAFHVDSSSSTGASTRDHVMGFLFTLGASAGYSLCLSLTQCSFQKVLKKETYSVIFKMLFYTSAVATCMCVVGLFASGEWRRMKEDMEGFEKGKVSYVMTLVWTALSWQICSIGTVGLIFEVSSLFTNVISTLGLPVIPILAVVFFHDRVDGVKVMAMLLAIWGFVSYIYQHYLDDSKSKRASRTDLSEESYAASSSVLG